MKIAFYLAFLIIILPNSSNQANSDIEIEKIANMGILVKYKEQSLIIDALFEKHFNEYEFPSKKSIKKLFKLKYLKYVLVTHTHRDHYDFGLTNQLIKEKPTTVIIPADSMGPKGTVAGKRAGYLGLISFMAMENVYDTFTIDYEVFKITGFRLPHVGRSKTVNICYLIEFDNGKRILHTGDADLAYLSNEKLDGLLSSRIDIAFLPFFEVNKHYKELKEMNISKIVPVHFDLRVKNIEEQLRELNIPNLTFLQKKQKITL
ncbi:MBL fold metallo-hydrolase [Winogradskyella sp. 3972H.M.0a.05]|uniref:MBL fold metallo-hydrolase n=1 Tax=Winogradskyella sp. 3972H.M.0a.05 TaxID=2950277 RepID=UPI00339669CF